MQMRNNKRRAGSRFNQVARDQWTSKDCRYDVVFAHYAGSYDVSSRGRHITSCVSRDEAFQAAARDARAA